MKPYINLLYITELEGIILFVPLPLCQLTFVRPYITRQSSPFACPPPFLLFLLLSKLVKLFREPIYRDPDGRTGGRTAQGGPPSTRRTPDMVGTSHGRPPGRLAAPITAHAWLARRRWRRGGGGVASLEGENQFILRKRSCSLTPPTISCSSFTSS